MGSCPRLIRLIWPLTLHGSAPKGNRTKVHWLLDPKLNMWKLIRPSSSLIPWTHQWRQDQQPSWTGEMTGFICPKRGNTTASWMMFLLVNYGKPTSKPASCSVKNCQPIWHISTSYPLFNVNIQEIFPESSMAISKSETPSSYCVITWLSRPHDRSSAPT